MAIKQRKQLTGTTEQINAYAGVEGQLVWDKTKKKWVGMSGTAGTNYPMASESHSHSISNVAGLKTALDGKATTTALTEGLAGKANTSHTHIISNVTGLQDALDGKQPVGDYATTTELTTGLNGKLGKTEKANSAKVADTANSVAWSNVTGRPSISSSPAVYVTTVENKGTMWYRKWSNGFIEQGDPTWKRGTISFGWPFKSKPCVMCVGSNRPVYLQSASNTSFTPCDPNEEDYRDTLTGCWYACGF